MYDNEKELDLFLYNSILDISDKLLIIKYVVDQRMIQAVQLII